jgi:hypothetical protein
MSVSEMFDLLKSGDTSISVSHILERLTKLFHEVWCGAIGIVTAWI